MTPPHLQTQRLNLKPLRPEDFEFFCALKINPQTRAHLGGPVLLCRCKYQFQTALHQPMQWAVHTEQCPIGLVSITPHHNPKDMELSYEFLPTSWGQGFAQEALGAAAAHWFAHTQNRLVAETQAANAASRRLLEKLGFIERERLQRFGAEQIVFVLHNKNVAQHKR